MRNDDDLRRWRLTTALRLPLALPHLYLAEYWGLVAIVVAIVNWFIALARGRTPDAVHAWLERYVRYFTHVNAYVLLLADPYPRFRGWEGTYPVDLRVDPPRSPVALDDRLPPRARIPAIVFAYVLAIVALVVAILSWFAALATARVPRGFQSFGAYCVRYQAQTYGYLLSTHRPLSEPCERERFRLRERRAMSANSTADRHPIGLIVERRPEAQPPDGVLPSAARDPAGDLAVRLGDLRRDRGRRRLARRARPRSCARRPARIHRALPACVDAPERVRPPARRSVAAVPRRARLVSDRPEDRPARASEPADGARAPAARDPRASPRVRLPDRQQPGRASSAGSTASSSGGCTAACATSAHGSLRSRCRRMRTARSSPAATRASRVRPRRSSR